VIIVVCTAAGGVFLLWAVWWVYRGTPKHGKHYTTVAPTVAAQDLAKAMYEVRSSGMHGADALDVLKSAAAGTDTRPAPPARHTHRDPTTGRYTRKAED